MTRFANNESTGAVHQVALSGLTNSANSKQNGSPILTNLAVGNLLSNNPTFLGSGLNGMFTLGSGNGSMVWSNNLTASNTAVGAVGRAPMAYWDGLNSRAGFGTPSPSATLTIQSKDGDAVAMNIIQGGYVGIAAPTNSSGKLIVTNDTSGNLRPGFMSVGNGTSFSTYGNGGMGNGGSVLISDFVAQTEILGLTAPANGQQRALLTFTNTGASTVNPLPLLDADSIGTNAVYASFRFRGKPVYFLNTNGNAGFGTTNPLASIHITNSTAQATFRIDQQSTTNDVEQTFVNNTQKSGVSTNGIYSLNTLATNAVAAVGYTNLSGAQQTAYVTATAVSFTLSDRSGNVLYVSPTLTATLPVTMQPGWRLTAASGLTGTVLPW